MNRTLSLSLVLPLAFGLLGCPHGAAAQGVAPYIDMSITADENIVTIASASGLKAFTLAFLDADGACDLGWGGLGGALPTDTLADGTSMLTIVQQLKAAGVTPIFSIGGADGVDPAAYCTSASSLQAVYQNAVSRYGITYLDFDIEGAATAETAQITLRDQALVGLKSANPGLIISYTIPVEPTGLVAGDGLNLLTSAKSDGVALSVVNIMTMDFGSSGTEMGSASTEAAADTEAQIKAAGLSSTVGITPMIGQNDTGGEIFTLADATTVVNFAKANSYVSRLAFWSEGRDNGSCAGDTAASPSCSGISQSTYQFAQIFEGFGGSGGSGGGGGGTTTEGPYGGTPAAIPGTVLAENYDTGGQGVGYDVTSTNGTDNGYRSDGVDLETASSPATGNDLGWSASGQWFKYTVNVSTAGTYTVTFLVAAESAISDAFHLSNSSGTNLSGSVAVPDTGGWQTWTTVTATVTLPAGTQTLTLNQDNGGWNIDSAAFALNSSGGGGGGATLNTGTPYNIVNENSGLCVGASGQGTANGTAVQMYTCANGTYSTQLSQEWIFTAASSGYYEVSDANATGETWNVTGNGTTNGSLVQLWTYAANSNEEFSAVSLGSGYYKFVGQGSGLCLDVPGNSTANSVQLEIYTCNGTTAQAFKLVTP